MSQYAFLTDVLALLIAAVVVVSVLRMLKISPILGFLLAGLLIGPHGVGIIASPHEVKNLAEFGVVFLLFTIGLELPWDRLISLRRYVFGLGLIQVLLTTAVFTGIGMFFGLTLSSALLVGGALSLSSTAIVLQVLAEREDLATRYGRIGFSILLFQDLIVVVFLILAALLLENKGVSGDIFLKSLGIALLKAVLVLAVIAMVGRFLLRPLYRWVASANNSELFVAMSLLLILTTGLATYAVGLSMELGAFLAGLLLAETEYRHQVEADIQPFKGLLLGLFFMTVGMDLNFATFLAHPTEVLCVLACFIFIKAIILFGLGWIYKIGQETTMRLTLMLATGGEFAFVLLAPIIDGGLLTQSLGQILLLAVSLSMVLTPFFASWGRSLGFKMAGYNSKHDPAAATQETADLNGHIIIVGFGRVGQTVGRLLSQQLVPYVAIDFNMTRVTEGRKQGISVFFGDARRAEIFRLLGVDKARAIVVTLDRPGTISRAVMMMRRNFPNISLFVRAQDIDQARKLEKAGAQVIVPEMLEPSLQLAGSVMAAKGIPADRINSCLESFRRSLLEESIMEESSLLDAEDTKISAGMK